MKVNTDLKSGNLVSSTSNLVSQGAAQVSNFLSNADQQARAATSTVTNTVQSGWNSLTGWLRLR